MEIVLRVAGGAHEGEVEGRVRAELYVPADPNENLLLYLVDAVNNNIIDRQTIDTRLIPMLSDFVNTVALELARTRAGASLVGVSQTSPSIF